MQQFKNILVYIDLDSSKSEGLARAVQLAKSNRAKLTAVTAVEPPSWLDEAFSSEAARHFEDHLAETETELRRRTADRVEGLETDFRVLRGAAWSVLIRDVLQERRDLLIKDAQPDGGVFGDHTDNRLLRKCPCPVWLVKQRVERFRRIAAAVDVHPDAHERDAFNAKICELASALAWRDQAELQIVRAWSFPGESLLAGRMQADELALIKKESRRKLDQHLQEFAAKYAKPHVDTHIQLVEGDPHEVLPAIVDQEHEDLLVMGTVARSGVAGWFIGNTAEKILGQTQCSVLAIKPEDFVSPVLPG